MNITNELGPSIIRWNGDMVIADNVIMTCRLDEKKMSQYIEICLKYKKKVKVKRIPFFIFFANRLKNPKAGYMTIKSLMETEKKKKWNTLIVKPIQPIRLRENKEFYFGGEARWELF